MTTDVNNTADLNLNAQETQETIEFTQALLRAFDREIEALKSRAAAGEVIDLDELDDNVDLRAIFEGSLEQLRRGTFGAPAPADRSPRRGH
jgi:hypothetical protein